MGKKITSLSILVLVLGLIVWIKGLNLESKNDSLLFAGIKLDQVKAITIEQFTNGIQLEKHDNWMVMPYRTDLAKKIAAEKKEGIKQDNLTDTESPAPADPAKIEQTVGTLLSLAKRSPVSTNPDKHTLFEITDAALHVTLWDAQNKKLRALFIGKQGAVPFTSYVRMEGTNDVLLVNQDLGALFKQSLGEWKAKTSPEGEKK